MLSDPEKPFEVLMEKILPFLLKPRECRKGTNINCPSHEKVK